MQGAAPGRGHQQCSFDKQFAGQPAGGGGGTHSSLQGSLQAMVVTGWNSTSVVTDNRERPPEQDTHCSGLLVTHCTAGQQQTAG